MTLLKKKGKMFWEQNERKVENDALESVIYFRYWKITQIQQICMLSVKWGTSNVYLSINTGSKSGYPQYTRAIVFVSKKVLLDFFTLFKNTNKQNKDVPFCLLWA